MTKSTTHTSDSSKRKHTPKKGESNKIGNKAHQDDMDCDDENICGQTNNNEKPLTTTNTPTKLTQDDEITIEKVLKVIPSTKDSEENDTKRKKKKEAKL